MSDTNGHGGPDAGAAVTAARPVVLVRYRPGMIGETVRTVHVVPLSTSTSADTVGAACGARLMLKDIETVSPGTGMPCTMCALTQISGPAVADVSPAGSPDSTAATDLGADGACYQEWGWPVTLHRDQVRLSLHRDVSALAIPTLLGLEVVEILTARGCTPPVLAHPYAPEHRIVLVGERYGVALPWPAQVHPITGFLLLPPTVTPRGPITWTQAPREGSLWLCREIDLFAALRTARRDATSGNPLPGGDPP